MNIWLVYYMQRIVQNRLFIDKIISTGKKFGLNIQLVTVEEIDELLEKHKPDAVIARMINPFLTLKLEALGIRVFNNYSISNLCNNKASSLRAINKLGIRHIPSIIVFSNDNKYNFELLCNSHDKYDIYDELINNHDNYHMLTEKFSTYSTIESQTKNKTISNNVQLDSSLALDNEDDYFYDKYIIKSVTGHGGKEVYLFSEFINNMMINLSSQEPDAEQYYTDKYLIQPLIEYGNRDLRVYIIGKNIIGAVLRTSETGFKSNFSLGGKVQLYNLNDEQKVVVQKIAEAFDFDYVGIDFLLDKNNNLIFNEIEDVVGARMLSSCSDIDYVTLYIEYINIMLHNHVEACYNLDNV